jgi:aminoglycoside phosphotransferase (APT) family kinase protein
VSGSDVERRLTEWFASQVPDPGDVRVEGLDRVEVGHSAETLLMTLVVDGSSRDVVVRIRPEPPGLLEPYDLQRQFTILRVLEGSPVRSPAVLWYEPTGDVLGRDFYVMERLPGRVIERGVPADLQHDPALVRRMCLSMVDHIGAIHDATVDVDTLPDGRDHLDRELDHWASEIERAGGSAAPSFAQLLDGLRAEQPAPCPRVTLVHGDTKPGNFAFVGDEVSAVFDWEMATVGDPRTDIGWAEVNWRFTGNVTSAPGTPSADEMVERWEAQTGIAAEHRPWYRAMQGYKIAAILLVGGHLYETGATTDQRLVEMSKGAIPLAHAALADLASA